MPRAAKPQANRTDLLTPGPQGTPPGQGQPNGQPIQVATGLPYGEHQALASAQAAAPLPANVTPAPAGPPAGPPQGMDLGGALDAAKNFQLPDLGELTRGTERPRESITAGLPGGPVPMNGPAPMQQGNTVSAMLTRMAAATGSNALSQLASRAQAVGQ